MSDSPTSSDHIYILLVMSLAIKWTALTLWWSIIYEVFQAIDFYHVPMNWNQVRESSPSNII